MKRQIILLATLTLLGFPFVGWLLNFFFGQGDFTSVFEGGKPLWLQLSAGLIAGTVFGFGAWTIVKSRSMESVRQKYGKLIADFRLNYPEIIYISLCAGIGEEILFRGILQPWLGVWITSVLFVAIHGYLNPFDRKIFFYGVYMTAIIALIGYGSIVLGLFSAIAAHTMIDVVLFVKLTKFPPDETLEDQFSFTTGNEHFVKPDNTEL
jgi:membrane protease YdiL (CAAX protease family)